MGRASGGRERRGPSEEEAEAGAGWPEEEAGEEVKLIILSFFRYHEQKMPGWPHDKKKLSIRALAQKYGVPYTSLQKRIAGTVTNMAPSSGGGKGNPHILAKSVEGKPKQFTLFAHFF